MPGTNFAEAIIAWSAWLESTKGRRPSTVVKYARQLQRFEAYCLESGLDPWTVSFEDLERYTGLFAHGLKPQTRRTIVSAIKSFYGWADKKNLVDRSPADRVEYPSIGRRLPRQMQIHNAEKLLMQPDIQTFVGLRDAAMLATLMGCGMRISGLVRMNRGHLLWQADDRLIILIKEKGERERYNPAPVEASVLIRAYMASPELLEMDLSLPNNDEVLWATVNNRTVKPENYHGEERRISPRSVDKMIKRYGSRAGIPKDELHPHAARHLFGTAMAEASVDLLERQTLMGHEDSKSTEIYTHLATGLLQRAIDKGNPLRSMDIDLLRDARQLAGRLKASLK